MFNSTQIQDIMQADEVRAVADIRACLAQHMASAAHLPAPEMTKRARNFLQAAFLHLRQVRIHRAVIHP